MIIKLYEIMTALECSQPFEFYKMYVVGIIEEIAGRYYNVGKGDTQSGEQ
jgi:hypothetical protein